MRGWWREVDNVDMTPSAFHFNSSSSRWWPFPWEKSQRWSFPFLLVWSMTEMNTATFLTKSTRTYALKSHPNHTYFLGRPYSWAAMFHVPRPHRLPVWNYVWSHARKEASPPYSQTSFFTSLLPRGHPKLHHSFYLDLSSNALWLLKKKIIPQKRNLPLKDKDQQH